MDIPKYLSKLSKKPSPSRVSYQYEKAINWDFYTVYIDDTSTNKKYMFESFDAKSGLIEAKEWNAEEQIYSSSVTLHFNEINPNYYNGVYYYCGHEYNFSKIQDLMYLSEIKFKIFVKLSNLRQNISKYLYNQKNLRIKNRMLILDSIIELYLDNNESQKIPVPSIMFSIYGEYWIYHKEAKRMLKELKLALNAYVASGDIIKHDENYYSPLGKAFITQSEYVENARKHKESASIQRAMLFTAFFSFLAAAVSAYAALKQINLIP